MTVTQTNRMSPDAVSQAWLSDRYLRVREFTEALAARLTAEDQVVQSMPDASPTKWHRGHTTWFFEEFVLARSDEPALPDPTYRYLFNSYYEAVGPRQPRPRRGLITRPSVQDVAAYRRRVDRQVLALLDSGVGADLAALVYLGTHHEQQHQELLLMDIKHAFAQNPLRPAYQQPGSPDGQALSVPTPSSPSDQRHLDQRHPDRAQTDRARADRGYWGVSEPMFTSYDGGLVEIGHSRGRFAFDNEGPRHRVWLDPFRMADRLVTCGEWLEFIDDDGYAQPRLWLSDGWATVQAEDWQAPLYWERDSADGWRVFTLTGMRPLDPSAPVVHVSYYEADAFARWAGYRLPSEAEWETVAAAYAPTDEPLPNADPWPQPRLHPRPVRGHGVSQLFGEVWQWTSSAYESYPGFRAAAGAVGEYNGKFMVDQHVLRGSSCITPPGHARLTYRNFFPASARWPFTGLRLAADG